MEIDLALLKMLFDKAPVGIALLDLDRTVQYCNPEFARIYGWEDDGIIGTVLPIPEHQRDNYNQLVAGLRNGLPFVGMETVRVRRDGTEFYARISGSPVPNKEGKITGFVASIAVSEENHSEQLELRNLEYLVQGSSELMCVADLDLRLLFMNDRGKEMIGFPLDEEVDGRSLVEFFVGECRQRLEDIFNSVRPTSAGYSSVMHLKHQETGAPIPVFSTVYLVHDPHTGQPISIGLVSKNLSEQQETQRLVNQAEAAFRVLFDNVPFGLLMVDSFGHIMESNGALHILLGYTAQELNGQTLAKHIYPPDLTVGRTLFLQLIAGAIERYEVRKRLLHKDGEKIAVRMRVFLVRDHDGLPKHTISMIERLWEATWRPSDLTISSEHLSSTSSSRSTN